MDRAAAFSKVNEDVFIALGDVVRLDRSAVDFVRQRALASVRGRARICAHKASSDAVHEMIIAITLDSYIRPHRHRSKTESFHLIEGEADVAILTDAGAVDDVVQLRQGGAFYYRLETPRYHTLLLRTPLLVIHETTAGPFSPAETDMADFAPEESDADAAREYIGGLRRKVDLWAAERPGTR
jgi:cupin fold WbuC family metalloprotein